VKEFSYNRWKQCSKSKPKQTSENSVEAQAEKVLGTRRKGPKFRLAQTVNADFKTKKGEEKQNFQLLLCSQVSFGSKKNLLFLFLKLLISQNVISNSLLFFPTVPLWCSALFPFYFLILKTLSCLNVIKTLCPKPPLFFLILYVAEIKGR